VKAENSSGTAWAAHGGQGKGFSCASNLNRISVVSSLLVVLAGMGEREGQGTAFEFLAPRSSL